jgi:hypothetical protein
MARRTHFAYTKLRFCLVCDFGFFWGGPLSFWSSFWWTSSSGVYSFPANSYWTQLHWLVSFLDALAFCGCDKIPEKQLKGGRFILAHGFRCLASGHLLWQGACDRGNLMVTGKQRKNEIIGSTTLFKDMPPMT